MRAVLALALSATMLLPATASAQTRSVRDTTTAYGARLNAQGQPANLNPARINSRIPSRIDTRLSLRIERYRPDASTNLTAAFQTRTDDRTRTTPIIAAPQQQVDIDDAQ